MLKMAVHLTAMPGPWMSCKCSLSPRQSSNLPEVSEMDENDMKNFDPEARSSGYADIHENTRIMLQYSVLYCKYIIIYRNVL